MADDAYIGEIRMFPYGWTQEGWIPCDGRELSPQNHQALFSIIENTYGGTYPKTFCVPDLRGYAVMGSKESNSSDSLDLGKSEGTDTVTLDQGQVPSHYHNMTAVVVTGTVGTTRTATPLAGSQLSRMESGGATATNASPVKTYAPAAASGKQETLSPETIGVVGAGGAHENRQPFCVFNFCMCVDGEYPAPAN